MFINVNDRSDVINLSLYGMCIHGVLWLIVYLYLSFKDRHDISSDLTKVSKPNTIKTQLIIVFIRT